MTPCDLIIIGGGPGGYPAAQIAAAEGLNVVLIERDRLLEAPASTGAAYRPKR